MSSEVLDVASMVARGYTRSGRLPGGRFDQLFFWPWATILACVGALGLFAGTLLCIYRLLQFFMIVAWVGLTSGG